MGLYLVTTTVSFPAAFTVSCRIFTSLIEKATIAVACELLSGTFSSSLKQVPLLALPQGNISYVSSDNNYTILCANLLRIL